MLLSNSANLVFTTFCIFESSPLSADEAGLVSRIFKETCVFRAQAPKIVPQDVNRCTSKTSTAEIEYLLFWIISCLKNKFNIAIRVGSDQTSVLEDGV